MLPTVESSSKTLMNYYLGATIEEPAFLSVFKN
jgi:hypothetical protein